jgi:UDP-N-acetylmuramoyl-tripeptide--D-alanyl-D-alanine ligase
MNAWAWDVIASIVGGAWHIAPKDDAIDFVGVSIDTRTIEHGQVFFAFEGEQVDGHDYLINAQDRGAGACVVTHPDRVPDGLVIPVLVVGEALGALTRLADGWRDRIGAKVIAITGSNGKTTSCRLMQAVCDGAGKTAASPKSFNNALGVPITILNTPLDAEYLVAEVGMSTPGEIGDRTRLLRPDVAIITSIGRAHLEGLGSIENIAKEKADLIRSAPKHARGVIPGGVDVLDAALADDPHEIERLTDVFRVDRVESHGCVFSMGDASFEIPLMGDYNAANAALCVLAARALGIDDDTTRSGLTQATPPAMRLERTVIATKADPIVVINDAYNANPDSMRAALSTFVSLETLGRKVALLGEMLEMGQAGPAEHRSLAEHALNLESIDRVILLGGSFAGVRIDDPRAAIIAATSDDAIACVASEIGAGDTVLIKGSRGVRLERLIDKLGDINASDRSKGQGNAPTLA